LIGRDAFEQLYRDTAPGLERFAARLAGSRAAAEEIVQETWYRFLRSKFTGGSDEERRRYLYRIALNLMKTQWARERRRIEAEPAGTVEPSASTEVAAALERLSARDRTLLWLAYAEGYTHREMGEVMGVGAASVRVLLSRARKRFLDLMKGRS
jgi:RNA polymerase sigma-70 factor (ECF subfamily)